MSIRERIIDMLVAPAEEGPADAYYNKGVIDAATIAEARERELMAQRDELLEALKALLSDTQHIEHDCGDALRPVKAARAAIAKVEGGAK